MSTATITLAEDHTSNRAPQPGGGTQPQGRPGRSGLGVLASLVINFVVPLFAYYLIHARVASSALALAGAIPVAYTVVVLAVRRRLDPLGVVSVVTFGIGVLVSWASGGNALALELQDPALTGLIGMACLVSVVIGRPLHPVILRLLGRGNARYADIAARARRGTSMVTTLIIGLALTVHAVAITILALTQSTSTFVALQHVVGLPPVGLGFAALFFYRSRLQARDQPGQLS
ncbi:MAG: VC0807 family protein [Streptosporangiaceae bacterium]